MKNTTRQKLKKAIMIISILICLIFLSGLITVSVIYNKYDLDINRLTSTNNGIKVYSANGKDSTLYNTNRSIIEIEALPKYVLDAFIDTEDKRFYSHNGYDLKRIVKAGLVNMVNGSKSQGASTISQQLIKNTLLTNEKTYSRKIKELVLSIKMEKQFEKDEILEMYLNTIYFGSNAYGIENASKIYFNKSAKDLTINEACCLAGIIKSPLQYSPKINYENSLKRKNFVAKAMFENGSINEEDYNQVIASPIVLSEYADYDHSYEEEAIYEACSLLNISERELINRKYEIITFKDDDLQDAVIKANTDVIIPCEEKYNSNLDSLNMVISNEGKMLAYYAGSNFNLHNLRRQPASTLKPLAVYLPCIIHNILTPATPILDEEIDYSGFSPKNADNKYHGLVSTRYALSNSLNIPAVKALDYLGLNRSYDCLLDMGINIEKSDLNLSLALGSTKKGIYLKDLLSAYSILANQGVDRGISFIDKIIDPEGNIIYQHTDYQNRIFEEGDCFLINDMLKDTATQGSAKRLNSLSIPVASKTGTAYNGENNTDIYNMSYTSEHTLLCWISDLKDNYLPDGMLSSIETTEINKSILSYLYSDHSPDDFKQPDNIHKLPYDIVELEENQRLISPNGIAERYIAYDYFKDDYAPESIDIDHDFIFSVAVNKAGATISFDARKSKSYSIYKKCDDQTILLDTISNQSGIVEILDENIFKYSEVSYYIEDDTSKSDEINIRPKDYLINIMNKEILDQKKKWYV